MYQSPYVLIPSYFLFLFPCYMMFPLLACPLINTVLNVTYIWAMMSYIRRFEHMVTKGHEKVEKYILIYEALCI